MEAAEKFADLAERLASGLLNHLDRQFRLDAGSFKSFPAPNGAVQIVLP
jgi:hypothetical protein